MKSIREIYNSLKEADKTVIFQVKSRKALDKILEDLEEVDEWTYWDIYKEIPIKNIYLFVGKWRLGSAGIFPYKSKDARGEYRFDDVCVDWKSPPTMQWEQERKLNKFIDIFDKYRKDIKVSKKTYEEVSYD